MVIAVHDGAAHVADRIADVFAQEQSGAHLREVIVCSGGSTDDGHAIVRELARAEPHLQLLALPRGMVGRLAPWHPPPR